MGMILDGRNRARACEVAGAIPRMEQFPAGADPIAFVIDKNLCRRNLKDGQRALIAAELANLKDGQHQKDKKGTPIGVPQSDAAKRMKVGARSAETKNFTPA